MTDKAKQTGKADQVSLAKAVKLVVKDVKKSKQIYEKEITDPLLKP